MSQPFLRTVFFDESGHTGHKVAEPSQPYFVLAGVVLRDERAAEVELSAFTSALPGIRELHAADLLRRLPPERVAELSDVVRGQLLGTILCFADKAYHLACKCVDYYLDPVLNPRVSAAAFNSRPRRMAWCNAVLGMPDSVRTNFWQGYSRSDPALVRDSAIAAIAHLNGKSSPSDADLEIHAALRYVRGHASEFVLSAGAGASGGGFTWKADSPNVSLFGGALSLADRWAGRQGIRSLEVRHDLQEEMGAALQRAHQWLTMQAPHQLVPMEDGSVVEQPLKRLGSLQFVDSASSVGIQFADFVAYSLSVVARHWAVPPKAARLRAIWESGFKVLDAIRASGDILAIDPRVQ